MNLMTLAKERNAAHAGEYPVPDDCSATFKWGGRWFVMSITTGHRVDERVARATGARRPTHEQRIECAMLMAEEGSLNVQEDEHGIIHWY